jgi:FSR family fosmidomycin resistance protein-like MFS transporter
MPLGVLADRRGRSLWAAGAGCLVVLCGFLPLPAMASATVLGVGNAVFHVGGGLWTLTAYPRRAGPLGLFVSPGALGLYVGTVLGRGGLAPLWLLPVLLALGAAPLLTAGRTAPAGGVCRGPGPLPDASALAALAGLFAVVAARSLVGMGLSLPWKSGGWGLAAVCALALGKAAGGYLADRFGVRSTALVTLAAAAALFCFSDVPAAGLCAVFLFNMTMPLTLYGAAALLPGAGGLAFGLLTFALFLGFLPVYFGVSLPGGWAAAALAAVSAAVLVPALDRGAEPCARR